MKLAIRPVVDAMALTLPPRLQRAEMPVRDTIAISPAHTTTRAEAPMPQLTYERDDLLASHDYAEAHVVAGRTLHGGLRSIYYVYKMLLSTFSATARPARDVTTQEADRP